VLYTKNFTRLKKKTDVKLLPLSDWVEPDHDVLPRGLHMRGRTVPQIHPGYELPLFDVYFRL
jgi:hypothetical protein